MKPVLVHAEAEAELLDAIEFYESRVPGLGVEFKAAFEAAVRTIQQAPDRWPAQWQMTRRYLVHRFPYTIVYLDLPEQISIVVVAHVKRRPRYWRNRLRG